MMKVKKIYVNKYSKQGSTLKGFAKICVEFENGMEVWFTNLKIVESKSGDLFVSPPSESYTDKDGKKAYRNIYSFNTAMSNFIRDAVLNEFSKKNNTKDDDDDLPF